MNCIFLCIFFQENYIEMLYLLLESIFIFGNLQEDTEILIYTSTEFMNKIKKSHLYNENSVKFEINDNYNDINTSCKARLDFFNLESSVKYKKVLYLDTDIIICNDINGAFDVCEEDLLYVREEGQITDDRDFWGKSLFGDNIEDYDDKSAFTSGILLFNNCYKIKELFCNIVEDMKHRYHNFYDQPFIVYNSFKYKIYDNKKINTFVMNKYYEDVIYENIDIDNKIIHFPGGVGNFLKIGKMKTILNVIKDKIIVNNIQKTKEFINEKLLPIIHSCGELLEGNIFMLHHTTNYTDVFINKAKNISNIVLNRNIKNVMEIGFNSGFSTLLMLISNPTAKISCFDLGEHKYTLHCFNILKDVFGDRLDIIIGDSTKTLKNVNTKFDLIHIDGGHSTEVATSDIVNSYRLSKKGTILIMDDYDFMNLHDLWDTFKKIYDLQDLHINLYDSPHHDIKYTVM